MAEDKMPFLSHLEELRRRLIASLIAIGVGFSVSFYHSERIMGFLKRILTTTFAIQKTYPYVAVLSKPPPELPRVYSRSTTGRLPVSAISQCPIIISEVQR